MGGMALLPTVAITVSTGMAILPRSFVAALKDSILARYYAICVYILRRPTYRVTRTLLGKYDLLPTTYVEYENSLVR